MYMSNPLGKRLKEIREQFELTQMELGRLINLNYRTLSNYELGRAEPDIETLKKLSETYHMSIDAIVGNTHFDGLSQKINGLSPQDRKIAECFIDFLLEKGERALGNKNK